MAGDIPTMPGAPGKKKMPTKKKALIFLGATVTGGLAIYEVKKRSSASSAAAAAAANTSGDSTDDSDSGIDPNTGIPYADEVDSGIGLTPGDEGTYDPLTGTYLPGLGSTTPVTTVASNAEWAQAAEATLVGDGYDPATVAAALGAYLLGVPLTADQYAIVQAAIAFEGQPPNGAPPITQTGGGGTGQGGTGGGGTPPPTGTPVGTGLIQVPNVVGQRASGAKAAIVLRGLRPVQVPPYSQTKGKVATVTSQSPKAPAKVKAGSTVTINVSVKNK